MYILVCGWTDDELLKEIGNLCQYGYSQKFSFKRGVYTHVKGFDREEYVFQIHNRE